MQGLKNIIFDLGGVLIDWNPRRLFRKIFSTEEELDHFLEHICTMEWNEQQDAGRTLSEATQILVQRHPEYKDAIHAYYGRWEEMLGGPILGTVKLLEQIKANNRHRLLALTNWSAETFPIAMQRYDFLNHFEGILVSGEEGLKKPDPQIYTLLCDRYTLHPEESLFIDDNLRNVEAARQFGLFVHHFTGVPALEKYLSQHKIL